MQYAPYYPGCRPPTPPNYPQLPKPKADNSP